MLTRRSVLAALAASAAGPAFAQDFPNRTITIVNSFAAGGPTDVYLRPLAAKLADALGKPVVIEAVVGASGQMAASNVQRSAPDGHTLLSISNTHVINETLAPNRTYRLLTDFKPITGLYTSEHAVFVSNKVQAKTLAELVAFAKANPGKLTYASSGPGSTYHLAGELFKARAGVDLLHVPYRGSAQARTDLIGGQVDVFFDLIAPMKPQVTAGNIKVLATTGARRSGLMPDVPTVIEAGVPDYTAEAWNALLAPAGTPEDVATKIRTAVNAFQKSAEAATLAETQGMISTGGSGKDLADFMKTEVDRWATIIKAANLVRE